MDDQVNLEAAVRFLENLDDEAAGLEAPTAESGNGDGGSSASSQKRKSAFEDNTNVGSGKRGVASKEKNDDGVEEITKQILSLSGKKQQLVSLLVVQHRHLVSTGARRARSAKNGPIARVTTQRKRSSGRIGARRC